LLIVCFASPLAEDVTKDAAKAAELGTIDYSSGISANVTNAVDVYTKNRKDGTIGGGEIAAAAQIATYTQQSAASAKQGGLRRQASQAAIKGEKGLKMIDEDLKKQAGDGGATIYEHTMAIDEVEKMYHTSAKTGIENDQRVTEMRDTFGQNMLTPPKVDPWWWKLFLHMVGGFSLLLWGGSFLCFAVFIIDGSADNLYLGVVLSVVVFLTAVFSWFPEMKSDAAMSAFKNMVPTQCSVLRTKCAGGSDNFTNGFEAIDLVRGDVVEIKSGERIPADVMIFQQSDMKVDQAALTGEPIPLVRDTKCTNDQPHETKNLCFYGTFCTQGSCRGFVLRTGDETMVGQIAKQTMEGVAPKTTMEIEIEHFIHIVSGVAAVIGVVFFIIALINGYTFIQSVVFMIGIIVANVPEGLLATVTVALTLTAETMASVSVLVKDSKTIETLGSITCIASDKTGTLTQNRMTATHAIYSNRIVTLDAALSDNHSKFDSKDIFFSELRRVACLCGTAAFIESEKTGNKDLGTEKLEKYYDPETKTWNKRVLDRKTTGDASESAILKFCEPVMEEWFEGAECRVDDVDVPQKVHKYRTEHKLVGGVPFNSTNKWMCTMHETKSKTEQIFPHDEGDLLVMVKGAPERIMAMAKYIMIDPTQQEEDQKVKGGGSPLVPWDEKEYDRVAKMQMALAASGERVLGFGYCVLKKGQEQLLGNGCVQNAETGLYEIDADAMSAMPGNVNFKEGGFLWADAGESWEPTMGAKDGKSEESFEPWTAPKGNTGMIFVGMMSLVDPPRLEVPKAIAECHTAGIKVVMVTGDHPVTAKAISERIGILKPNSTIEDWVMAQLEKGNMKDLETYMWDKEWDEENNCEKPGTGFQITLADGNTKTWDKVTEREAYEAGRNPANTKAHQQEEVKKMAGLKEDSANNDAALFYGNDARWQISDAGRGDHTIDGVKRLTAYKDPIAKWWRGFKFHDKDGNPHANDPVQGLVVAGPQLDEFTEADWRYALSRPQLTFARTLPAQKQDIVDHMQNHHTSMAQIGILDAKPQVVAVTGDGVNDSPALKKADCGVAMGTGSEVAQEAANMILMNDDFASIVEGIKQGRLIFDNLKKSIAYTLTSNIPEITPFLALILLKIPIPLETVMILCIDLGTDMLPAISLAYEMPESDIMKRMPRNKEKDHLVNNKLIGLTYGMIGMIQAAAGFTSYFSVFGYYHVTFDDISGTGFSFVDKNVKFVAGLDYDTRLGYLRQAQTAFLMSIIIVQWTDVMICKTRMLSILEQGMSNSVLNIGLLEETLLGLALAYVPFCQTAFKTAALEAVMWTYAIPFAILILVFDEVRKFMLRQEQAEAKKAVEGTDRLPDVGWVEGCTYY